MLDPHYSNQKLADHYDLDNPWSIDRDFYLALAPSTPIDILDLGCGTGLLCNAYAKLGHRVTGVDPALPMLNVARKKPNGRKIDWICVSAQTFSSSKRFDLIIMTGHAFQVLLTDDEVATTLIAMRQHLKPRGRIVFESRNPNMNWAEIWNHDFNVGSTDAVHNKTRQFSLISDDNEFITFEIQYRLPKEVLTSRSKLRFMSRCNIESHLKEVGLKVEAVLGDWGGGPFEPQSSEEMIFFAGLVKT
jgi:2-polyprenyl-3-methyl-5-hydroxy-6-metoxy-1,4-benzoquinol methylase